MLEYLDKLQKEDMEQLIKKRQTQRAVMKDVALANDVRHFHFMFLHVMTTVLRS